MTELGDKLLKSMDQAIAIAKGDGDPARVYRPAPVDVKAIRSRQKLSQQAFADRFGLSVKTVRDWEQGRRVPDGPAALLLRVIDHNPGLVESVVNAA